jgi:hypothetical protein
MRRFGEDMGEDDRNMKGNVRAAIQVDSASDFLASLRTPTNIYIYAVLDKASVGSKFLTNISALMNIL